MAHQGDHDKGIQTRRHQKDVGTHCKRHGDPGETHRIALPTMKPVLLLVDLQRDYLSSPCLEPSSECIVGECSRLLEACRSGNIPVIHIWTSVSRDVDERMQHWKAAQRWHCEVGTPGHAPPQELSPTADEFVVHKTGFSPFTKPDLAARLAAGDFDTVIVAGVHLHACVKATVLGAYERGMNVWVAEGAAGSDDPLHAAITRRYLSKRAIHFGGVDDIIAMLDGSRDVSRAEPVTTASSPLPLPLPSAQAAGRHPIASRAALLEVLAKQLEERAGELALEMAGEIGKPVHYGEGEVRRTAAMLRTIIQRVEEDASTNHGDPPEVRHRPLGCVAVITPWNNPFYIPLSKIAPALLYGNTVAWKPSPLAAGISKRIYQLLQSTESALENLLTLVEGDRTVAECLMDHPAIQAVTLTGSLETGFSAHDVCARRHLPFQAELGGNNAAIVWEDADLEHAARCVAEGAFALAGQRCTANRRVIVYEACREEFLSHLVRATDLLGWGDPRITETRIGPLVSPSHCTRFKRLLRDAARSGAVTLWTQEQRVPDPAWKHEGAWHPPVIISCDDPQAEVVQRESFAPLLVVQTATGWDDAIALLNGVSEGLAAAVFTRSDSIASRFLAEAQAGILKINQSTADAGPDLPFGGWKSSGIGPPEHGRFDREFYTRAQTVYGSTGAR
jgi:acyl-CoA reductase-like NAD-dependent aldehyde dehydrogenase/nicotinamidase-related amidase